MRRFFRIAPTLFAVHYAYMLEYRAEIVLWALSGCLPFILMGLWLEASQNGGFALNPVEFARYFLVAFIVRQFNVVWVVWEFEKEVVEGKLSMRLLQPLDPVWHHVAAHVAERSARVPFIGLLILVFFALYPDAFWVPNLGRVFLWIVVVLLGFILRFLIQYTFALLGFWIERVNAIEQFWFLFYLFFSGMVAPLEVFPESVRQVVLWTPFPYMIHFPAALLVGLPVNVLPSVAIMCAWVALFWIINRWLWRRGLRQYSGMGA